MVFQLAIVIIIPIILGIVAVSPFEEPVLEEPEEVPSEPEASYRVLYILLGIIWLIFLFRILRQLIRGTYRIKTKF